MSLVLSQVLNGFISPMKGTTTMSTLSVTCPSSTPPAQEDSHIQPVVPTVVHKLTTEERVCILIDDVCEELDFDNPALIKAIVKCESNFHKDSVSDCNARGLMQITPRWFSREMQEFGVTDLCEDEIGNLRIGISHIKKLIHNYNGNISMALVAYHDGSSAVANGVYSTIYSARVLRAVGGYS